MAFLDGVHDGQALELYRAVPGLCWREGGAAALYECQFVFVYLHQGEANAVEARGISENDRFYLWVKWLQHGRRCERLLGVLEIQFVLRQPDPRCLFL